MCDGEPHHICIMRDKSATAIRTYVNGAKTRHVSLDVQAIPKGYKLVIGQMPGFQSGDDNIFSFQGEISGFNIWNSVLSIYQVFQIYRGIGAERGNVIGWRSLKRKIHGELEIVQGPPLESHGT